MADEKAGAGPSARDVEMEQLSAVLSPLSLTVHEIAADGHCLYRSMAHQLQITGETHYDFRACRKLAADYIRSHPNDFLPYLLGESSDDSLSPDELISAYCATVESSSEWGGTREPHSSQPPSLPPASQALGALELTLHPACARFHMALAGLRRPARDHCVVACVPAQHQRAFGRRSGARDGR